VPSRALPRRARPRRACLVLPQTRYLAKW
jgi:hypothetical protein